jgi:hypothetical protein
MLPGVKGLRGPLSCLNQARFGISFGAVGAAMACYDEALSYTKDRVAVCAASRSPAHQLVQLKLVDMLQEITKAQLLSLQLGRLKEAGKSRPQQVSLAKRNNVKMALDLRPQRPRPARRQRHHRRVPKRPSHVQPRVGLHLRGHRSHPHLDCRRGHHRQRRFRSF